MKAVPTAIAHRAIIPLRLRKTKQLTSQPARLQVRERRIVQMRHQTIPTETKSRAGKLRALLRIRPKPPDADQPNSRRICGNGARIRTNRAPPPTHTHHKRKERQRHRGEGWVGIGGGERIGYLSGEAARAAEKDLLEAGVSLDELVERRLRLRLRLLRRRSRRRRRRRRGGRRRGGHRATRRRRGGNPNPNPSLPLSLFLSRTHHLFAGVYSLEKKKRRRGEWRKKWEEGEGGIYRRRDGEEGLGLWGSFRNLGDREGVCCKKWVVFSFDLLRCIMGLFGWLSNVAMPNLRHVTIC